MPTFTTPDPISAVIEVAAGSVHLIAADRDDTVVDVRPRDESRTHDVKAAEQMRVNFHNGTLTVSSKRGFSFPRRGAVAVDIALPTGSRLQASVASAQLTADGQYADCKLASASGDVSVESVIGKIKADTASGDVSIQSAKASASLASASGDASIGVLEGDVKFQAASGSLTVGRLQGNVNAQTASGDATVATAVNGVVSVQTSSGEVQVGIAEGTAARLDLRTHSGEVSNTLQPSDGPAEGDQTLAVHVRTASGGIRMQRASAAGAVS
jgi:Putative adhesin